MVIHVAVYQGQKVISVRPGGLPEVNNRYPIAINVIGDSAVVPRQIAFGIQRQKAHAAGAGVFQIGVEEKRRLALEYLASLQAQTGGDTSDTKADDAQTDETSTDKSDSSDISDDNASEDKPE